MQQYKFIGPSDGSHISSSFLKIAGLFLLGISGLFSFDIGGALNLQEAIFVFGFFIICFTTRLWQDKQIRIAGKLLGAWMLIQLATDFSRHIPIIDLLKGMARITCFGSALFCLWVWTGRTPRLIAAFCAGIGCAAVLSYYIFPNETSAVDPWKWNFGPALSLVVVAVMLYFNVRRWWVWAGVMFALAVLHGLYNFRSFAGIHLTTAGFIIVQRSLRRMSMLTRTVIAVVGAMLVIYLYTYLASTGVLGEAVRAKFIMQAGKRGSVLSVLSGGRGEYRASLHAISDSPLWGYGSWAKHPEYVLDLWDDEKGAFNIADYAGLLEAGNIPTHSYLLGAWVDGGLLAGALWLLIWVWVLGRLLRNDSPGALSWLSVIMSLHLLWSILFSPFGLGNRVFSAFALVVILSLPTQWNPRKDLRIISNRGAKRQERVVNA